MPARTKKPKAATTTANAPIEIVIEVAPPATCPPGHLERCENQVVACERLVRRTKGGWARRDAEWKLKHAKRRRANAKTLKPRPG